MLLHVDYKSLANILRSLLSMLMLFLLYPLQTSGGAGTMCGTFPANLSRPFRSPSMRTVGRLHYTGGPEQSLQPSSARLPLTLLLNSSIQRFTTSK